VLLKCCHFSLVDPRVYTNQFPAQGINHSLPLILATSSVEASRTSSLCCLSARWRVPRVDFSCFQSHQVAISRVDFSLPQCFGRLVFAREPVFPVLDSRAEAAPRCLISFCRALISGASHRFLCASRGSARQFGFGRSVRSFVLPPKEWLPAIARSRFPGSFLFSCSPALD
jgi:hypothetical protein